MKTATRGETLTSDIGNSATRVVTPPEADPAPAADDLDANNNTKINNTNKENEIMSKPISYQQATIVDLPADEVWAHVANYAFDLQWRDGLTDMTPTPAGPPQTGTIVHEELRSMGTTMVNDTTVTMTGEHAYRFVGGGSGGQVEGGREVIALAPARSEFTYDINLTLNGPAKYFGPALRPILRRNLKKDLGRFRTLVETDVLAPIHD